MPVMAPHFVKNGPSPRSRCRSPGAANGASPKPTRARSTACCAAGASTRGRPAAGPRATSPRRSPGGCCASCPASVDWRHDAAQGAQAMAHAPDRTPTPEQLVAELVLLLDLEPRGGDRFVGARSPKEAPAGVFGGQAIAQALAPRGAPCPKTAPPTRSTPISCAAAATSFRSTSASSATSTAAASPTAASSPASKASRSST